MTEEINRGEIWLANLNPSTKHEQSGTRPVLILSNDLFNHSLAEMTIVVPVTSRRKGIISHVELPDNLLRTKSYIKTEHVRVISSERLIKKICKVGPEILNKVEVNVKYLLGFH